jgi:hypothetical protein
MAGLSSRLCLILVTATDALGQRLGCGLRCLDPAGPCLDTCWLWLRFKRTRHEEGCAVQRWVEEWASKRGLGRARSVFSESHPWYRVNSCCSFLVGGWGRDQEVVRLQWKSIRHKHAYLPTYCKEERRGKGWALARSTQLRPNSVHDGDGLLKWRLSKCGCGPFAALQLPAGRKLLLVAS